MRSARTYRNAARLARTGTLELADVRFPAGESRMPTGGIDRVWDIVEKAGVGMLTTRFGGGLRARPLEPRPDREAGMIRFVTDVRGRKDDEIEAQPDVCFIVIEPKDKAYLSITGRADRDARPRHGCGDLEEDRRRVVAGRTGRSERARAGLEPVTGGAVGRAVKLGGRGLRIRQGEDHRREAEPRREPQEDGDAVRSLRERAQSPARPTSFFHSHQAPTPSAVRPQERRAEDERRQKARSARTRIAPRRGRSPIRNTAARRPGQDEARRPER